MIVHTHGPALGNLIDDLPFDLEDRGQTDATGEFCADHAQLIMANLGGIFRDTTLVPTAKMIAQLTDFVDELVLRYPLRNVASHNQREMWLECLADLARTYEQTIAEVYFKKHHGLGRHLNDARVGINDRNEFLHAVVLGKIRSVHLLQTGHYRKVRRLNGAIDNIIAHLEEIKPQLEWRMHLERLIAESYKF